MVFIPDPDQGESDGHDDREPDPVGPAFEKEKGRKKASASEEVAKVDDLIEVGDIEEETARRVELISMGKEVQKNEPEGKANDPESGALTKGL